MKHSQWEMDLLKIKRFLYLLCICIMAFTISAQAYSAEERFLGLTIEQECDIIYPDIPLDEKLLDYIYKMCSEYGIDFYMFLGLIYVETGGTFKTDLVSETNDYGLCQINLKYKRYHCELFGLESKQLDLFNPYDNVYLSIRMLDRLRKEYVAEYEGVDLTAMILTAYNMGMTGAERQKTEYSKYANAVIKKMEEFKND